MGHEHSLFAASRERGLLEIASEVGCGPDLEDLESRLERRREERDIERPQEGFSSLWFWEQTGDRKCSLRRSRSRSVISTRQRCRTPV